MKTGAIVRARMGSTRLPGKVLRDLAGRPVLDHVIDRLKQCGRLDTIVVATTWQDADTAIVERAQRNGVKAFRASERDVLSRCYLAARDAGLDIVVRIAADCPLIDPFVVDEVVGVYHREKQYEVVTNVGDGPGQRTYPRGLETEVFSFGALREAFERARDAYDREHVTPYLWAHRRVYVHRNAADHSAHRWTLDSEEDYRLLEAIYRHLYRGRHDFYMKDVLQLLERHPEIHTPVEMRRLSDG